MRRVLRPSPRWSRGHGPGRLIVGALRTGRAGWDDVGVLRVDRARQRHDSACRPAHSPLNWALAGFLKSENLLSYSLGKVDKSELVFVEKVVVPALVDDPYEIVLGCSRIGQNPIDLAEDQRGFVPSILEAQRKLFGRSFHGLSR